VKYLQLSAENNNSYGETLYATLVMDGINVAKNASLALELLNRAVNVGNALAQGVMANWFQMGMVMPQELNTSFELYRSSSEQNNSCGQTGYGLHLVFGLGGIADPAAGARIIKQAADAGYAKALYYYGMLWEEGIGVTRDRRRAARFYRQAMELKNPNAKGLMGNPTTVKDHQRIEMDRRKWRE
jgi:TPR repeat protein